MAAIQNAEELAVSDARRDALAIAEAGYAAVNVGAAFARAARIEGEELVIQDKRFQLAGRRVFFVGVGKCAIAGAEAVERLLGERLTGGIALDVRGVAGWQPAKVEAFVGTHPKPSEQNLAATSRIMGLLSLCEEDDLVVMLISGGGSTLLCLHDAPMTCIDEGLLFDALTEKGATIQEMNTVRKHISKARGGSLAAVAYPAEVVALVVSDVPGNDIRFVASGPTVLDESTAEDVRAVLARYGVPEPPGGLLETPKDASRFARTTNLLLLTNRDALEAMAQEAAARGYTAHIEDDNVTGEAQAFAHRVVERLAGAPARTALLYGGETTVTLSAGHPPGGRCQETALAALMALPAGALVLPFASDGRDATDHAGAIADAVTASHAATLGLSAEESLKNHATYEFFTKTGDALVTGSLESNVSDLLLALTSP